MRDESFPQYLISKQSIDDRALNKDVLAQFQANLPSEPFSIVEVGAGIGTMLTRLLRWEVFSSKVSYTLVDSLEENIRFGMGFLSRWGEDHGFRVSQKSTERLVLYDDTLSIHASFVQADVFDYISQSPTPVDVLIAHAFLDLLPLPESLPALLSLTNGLAWFTLVFDGVSTLLPFIEPELDDKIERLYHESMDSRESGGEYKSGRRLFEHLIQAGVRIISAGSSDWVVFPKNGRYEGDEAIFLNFIIDFFQETLGNHPELEGIKFSHWLETRREQIARGELVYLAHQLDFLVAK